MGNLSIFFERLIFLGLLLSLSFAVLRFEGAGAYETGKIELISLSKKTIRINYGYVDGVRTGDVGKFFFKPNELWTGEAYIGEGQAIKVYKNQSYWSMKYEKPLSLQRGDEIVLFRYKDYRGWRGDLEVLRKKYVISQNQNLYMANLRDKEMQDRPLTLVKQRDSYRADEELSPLHLREKRENELTAYDISSFKFDFKGNEADQTYKNNNFLYPKVMHENKSNEELREDKFLSDFRLMVESHFQMIGNPEANLMEFVLYNSKAKRDPDFKIFLDKLSMENTFDEYVQNKVEKQKLYKSYKQKIREEGETWSERYSDEELVRLSEREGLNTEKERQNSFIKTKISNELQFSYAMEMNNQYRSKNEQDSRFKEKNESYRFSYELYLMRMMSDWWSSSFLFTEQFERGTFNGGLDNSNVSYQDMRFTVHYLYYLYENPARMEAILPYVGLGGGYGMSTMKTKYRALNNYDTWTFPSVILGLKYRFNSWFGISSYGLYEKNTYTLSDSSPSMGLKKDAKMSDLKLGLGIAYYFY